MYIPWGKTKLDGDRGFKGLSRGEGGGGGGVSSEQDLVPVSHFEGPAPDLGSWRRSAHVSLTELAVPTSHPPSVAADLSLVWQFHPELNTACLHA